MLRVQVLETASCVKNRVRLRTVHQIVESFPDPAYAGAFRHDNGADRGRV